MKAAQASNGDVVQVPGHPGRRGGRLQRARREQWLKLTPDVLADIMLGSVTNWNDPSISTVQPGRQIPESADPRRASRGRQWHDLYLHRLPEQGERRLEDQGRQRKDGQLAGGVVGGQSKAMRASLGRSATRPARSDTSSSPTRCRARSATRDAQQRQASSLLPTSIPSETRLRRNPSVSPQDFSIVNMPGADSYPICGYSWVMLWKNQSDAAKGQSARQSLPMVGDRRTGVAQCGFDYVQSAGERAGARRRRRSRAST